MYTRLGLLTSIILFAVAPSSTNYTLKTYDIGSGGSTSTSTNYGLQAGVGTQAGSAQASTSYNSQVSGRGVVNANVPQAPTFTNPANYYDRLKLVIDTGNNPSDTKYLIAISTDNFVTTNYVQTDNSPGSSQAIANYQTYAAWGGSGGFLVLGLTPSTTYQVKVKALQGNYTGSGYSPIATASTVATSVTYSVSTTLTSTPPFNVAFPNLTAGTVVNGNADAIINLTSNANSGGTVFVKDTATGLYSSLANTLIPSSTADLGVASVGYGGQVLSVGQTSGGPLTSQAPFNGSASSVGGLSSSWQPLFVSAAPLTGGNGVFRLKAKVDALTPSAADYGDTVLLVAAMSF